jgi:valyl-tRNA synthetase
MTLEGTDITTLPKIFAVTEADKVLLEALATMQSAVVDHLENFRFAQGLQVIHEFTWHQFADVYIEAAKQQAGPATQAILYHVLIQVLTLLHPFMPFVTEAIWGQIPGTEGLLITRSWPE